MGSQKPKGQLSALGAQAWQGGGLLPGLQNKALGLQFQKRPVGWAGQGAGPPVASLPANSERPRSPQASNRWFHLLDDSVCLL